MPSSPRQKRNLGEEGKFLLSSYLKCAHDSINYLNHLNFSDEAMSDELDKNIAALIGQMAKAREYLTADGGFDPASTRECVAAMKECAECIVILKSLRSGS